ncbi:hypothetical protein ACFQY4_12600 [Catellatospora bangladeshensis]|uniref:Uncharacterized protein n=1 Tax=Catellatospora bangladeshensis TaxID=310355 RepID=A0A8J3JQX4_9ACTN|nr:hypothetical protein [Catellatospora bangladeshensis]GIF85297.1 hypothetical protein Cba03nite_66460 [Catellatospora bangladeshensis]
MVLWIVLAVVLLSLVFLGLVVRVLLWRLAGLREAQVELQAVAARAQELAQTAQGLQAHGDSMKVRAELLQERLAEVKAHAGSIKPKKA